MCFCGSVLIKYRKKVVMWSSKIKEAKEVVMSFKRKFKRKDILKKTTVLWQKNGMYREIV